MPTFASFQGFNPKSETLNLPKKMQSDDIAKEVELIRTLNLTTTSKNRYRNHRSVRASSKPKSVGHRRPSAKNNNFLQSLGDPNATGVSST